MSALQVFRNAGYEVRVVTVDNEPWFVASDLCRALALADVSMALAKVDDDDTSSVGVIDSMGRMQNTRVVNESGMYTLVLRSRKPEAVAVRRWVTKEVIPAIRKTGTYSTPGAQPSIDMAALATAVATAVVSAFAPILAQLVGNQTPQQPPALSGPTGLVDSGDAPMLKAAEIGDIVGMNPGSVNAMLARYGYQRLAGKSWVPTEFGRPFARTQNGTRSGVMYTYLVWSMDVIGRIFPESRMA
jgi:prophage antirepressor-like protein